MTLARRVVSGTTQLAWSNVSARLISLITMPILTALLSPGAYGTAAIAASIVSLLSVLAIAGADVSYVRAYQSDSFESPQAVESFAWRFTLLTSIAACGVAGVGWIFLSSIFELPAYLIVFICLGIVTGVAHTMSAARARMANRYGHISISIAIAAVAVAATSIAIAYFWRQDEFALIVAMVLASLVPLLILGTPRISMFRSPNSLNPAERSRFISIGLAALLSAPAYWIMSSSDRWFLAYFIDSDSVGIYSVTYTVAVMGMLINNAILPVWTTETIRENQTNPDSTDINLGKVAERIFAAMLVVWLAIAAAGGDIVKLLAAPEFHAATMMVPIIALAVLFHGVIHIATGLYIIKQNLTRTIRWWVFGSISCLIANTLLIPSLGIIGAAISQAIGFFIVASGLMYTAFTFFPLRVRWSRLLTFTIAVFIAGWFLSYPWSAQPLTSLLLKLPAGLLVFFVGVKLFLPNFAQVLQKRSWTS